MRTSVLSALALLAASAQPAYAEAGDWIIRTRAIMVAPNEDTDTVLGSELGINNAVMPEVDFTYMWTKNIGTELILATTKHKISHPAGKLGSTWVLPPTLTLQYHFAPDAKIRPYVGAGVNYTMFYSEKTTSTLTTALGANDTDLSLKSSFGYAVQAGVDVDLNDKMFVNLDVKYIDIKTKARVSADSVQAARLGVDINPLVVGVGVGWRF